MNFVKKFEQKSKISLQTTRDSRKSTSEVNLDTCLQTVATTMLCTHIYYVET